MVYNSALWFVRIEGFSKRKGENREKERKKQALEANHYSLSALKAIKWADENPLISAKLVDKVLAARLIISTGFYNLIKGLN